MSVQHAVREEEARRHEAPRPEHLAPGEFIDSDHDVVRRFAEQATRGASTERERVAGLFAAVRDGIRYDPYVLAREPAEYRASAVLQSPSAFCVPKAVAYAAVARAAGIPARLGFADVRNHLQSERLFELMGTDLFVFHGYSELYLEGAWRKATPAFNAELCARFGVDPLQFDGSEDAMLHPFTGDGGQYMEYVQDRGVYADLPLTEFLRAIEAAYPGAMERFAATADPVFQDPS